MANSFTINEAPTVTTNDHWSMWRLVNLMLTAGWEFVGSSNGTTMSLVSSNWGTYIGSADQADAWMCLALPGNATQGFCFHYKNSASLGGSPVTPSRRMTYTTTGWNTAAANATTPPVAVGTTHVVRGDGSTGGLNWFGSNAGQAAITVSKMNYIIRDPEGDDPSFTVFGFNAAGTFVHCFGFHKIVIPATDTAITTIGDPYALFVGTPESNWTTNALPGIFPPTPGRSYYAVGPTGTLVTHEAATLAYPPTAATVANGGVKNNYISGTAVYTEPVFIYKPSGAGLTSYKGFVSDLRIHNAASSAGDHFNSGAFIKIVMGNGEHTLLPWNNTTTAIQTT